MAERAEEILDIAERAMRRGGFDAVSFRDIAQEVGIKSASVHYHFPTKADLGRAAVKRHAERFVAGLGPGDTPRVTPVERMAHLADACIAAYSARQATCLCAVLGSVLANLPPEAQVEVQAFYARLGQWIDDALSGVDVQMSAQLIIALLQGAMVMAVATGSAQALHEARKVLLAAAQGGTDVSAKN